MASLFSLQPRQSTGLTRFERYGSDLPHSGSMQDFIDPSLTGGEGLSLDPSEDVFDPRDLGRTEEGEYYSTATGTKFGTTPQFQEEFGTPSPTAPQRNAITGATSQQQANPLQAAQSALGGVGKIGSAFDKLTGLFGQQGIEDTEGVSLTGQETDWTSPEAVGSWLAKNPDSQVNLWAQEFGQTPEDIARMMMESGDFNLGTTGLDASFLDDFTKEVSPVTGAHTGISTAAGAAGSLAGGAGALLNAFNAAGFGDEDLQKAASVLGGIGNVANIVQKISGTNLNLAGGLGAGSSALSLIGSLAGNKGIGQAAGVLGGLGTIASVAPFVTGAATLPAFTGLTTALSANPYTAIVAAAIMQVMDLVNSLEQDYSAEHTLLKGLVAPIPIIGSLAGPEIDKAFLPSEDWMQFPAEVGKTASLEGSSLGALVKGLPYVQSKKELADAIAAFKSEVAARVGGYGEGSGTYNIPNLPGVGARTHGMKTTETDFGPLVMKAQQFVDALLPRLPDTYASQDNAAMRNFARFQNTGYATPQYTYDPSGTTDMIRMYGTATPIIGGQMMVPVSGVAEGTVSRPGQSGYDYSVAGAYPDPNAPVTTPYSAAWMQLTGQAQRPQTPAAVPAPPVYNPTLSQFDPYALGPDGQPLHPEMWGTMGGGV